MLQTIHLQYFSIKYFLTKIKLSLYNNCQISLSKLMKPLQSKYNNSLRQSDDEDITTLRTLVAQLIVEKAQPSSTSETLDQNLSKLKNQNEELKRQSLHLIDENKELTRQLNYEKQQKSKLIKTINILKAEKQSSFDRTSRSNSRHNALQQLTPISLKLDNYRNQQLHYSEVGTSSRIIGNRDQLYRLNSYMIEHNTNIKLLTQKYNYLLKLRGLKSGSEAEEIRVIEQAQIIFNNRKPISEAKSILSSSRKKYFDSSSSSDIEEQYNYIEEKQA